MADTYLQFYGLYHLTGSQVSVTIGGLDCGDFVVATDGSVAVPLGADTGGLLTASYITGLAGYTGEQAVTIYFDDGSGSAWYTIPVVIGLNYTSQGQLLRPAAEADVRSPSGGGLGKKRRIHRYAALLQNCLSGTLFFGTDFANTLQPANLRDATDAPGSELGGTTTFSGVYRNELSDDYSFDGMLAWQVSRPVPATVCQVSGHLEAAED